MAKLTRLKTDKITADQFTDTRSHTAALWAIEVCNHIIDRVNQGDIVFEYEQLVKPAFELRFKSNGKLDGLFLKDGEGSWMWIVGDIRTDGPFGKITCRKYDIREFFKLWRVAKITEVNRVTDLTK